MNTDLVRVGAGLAMLGNWPVTSDQGGKLSDIQYRHSLRYLTRVECRRAVEVLHGDLAKRRSPTANSRRKIDDRCVYRRA